MCICVYPHPNIQPEQRTLPPASKFASKELACGRKSPNRTKPTHATPSPPRAEGRPGAHTAPTVEMTEMVDDQISSRGEPPSDKRLCGQALHICLATQCMRGVPDIRWLLRAQVSQVLRQAVHGALPLLPRIVFPAHVTGADVLAMLMRVAGANLKAVSLGSCRQLSAVDIGCILADLAARCPAVIEVNLTDCGEEAILRALAVCAQTTLGARSSSNKHSISFLVRTRRKDTPVHGPGPGQSPAASAGIP